ncbi:MAG: DsbE family thiol:disulfide interchange protein [Pseudomonadota bacterium]
MTRYLLPVVVFALLVGVFSVGLTKDPSKLPSPLLGGPVPEFELPELTRPGVTVSDDDLRGRYSLVNVWASWCFACRQEHDFLLNLNESGTISVYGLNWRDDLGNARRWLADLGDPYVATAVDQDGRTGIDFGVYGAPETFLIDPDGNVIHKHVSPMTAEVWARDFEPLIRAGGSRQ